MILVTVGMNPFGFNRLVRAADEYAASVDEAVVIQSGSSSYTPRYARFIDYASPERLSHLIKEARVVVTHCAAGSILTLLDFRVPIVVVTRKKSYDEALDDHQEELAEVLSEKRGIYWLHDVSSEGLHRLLSEHLVSTTLPEFPPLAKVIGSLLDSIDSNMGGG